MKTARMSAGIGVALLFCVFEVLTSSRFEKKVERSGRRGCWGAAGSFGMLCSTAERGQLAGECSQVGSLTFIRHRNGDYKVLGDTIDNSLRPYE